MSRPEERNCVANVESFRRDCIERGHLYLWQEFSASPLHNALVFPVDKVTWLFSFLHKYQEPLPLLARLDHFLTLT